MGQTMLKLLKLTVFITLVISIHACSDAPLSKEDQIRQYIDTGVEAAENRSHNDLAEMIDDAYTDQKAFNKPQITKLLQAYFFRHKNIFLLTKIRDINFPGEDEANVTLHVAMAGSLISDASALANLRARIYRFELALVKTDSWLLHEASWQPASMADMQ